MTLILIGVLSLLTAKNYKRGTFIRLGMFTFIGIGLAMLAIMVDYSAWNTFGVSAWILPVVVLCYFTALVVIHVWPKNDEEP
jgi:hypothetical protein